MELGDLLSAEQRAKLQALLEVETETEDAKQKRRQQVDAIKSRQVVKVLRMTEKPRPKYRGRGWRKEREQIRMEE